MSTESDDVDKDVVGTGVWWVGKIWGDLRGMWKCGVGERKGGLGDEQAEVVFHMVGSCSEGCCLNR